MQLTKVHKVLLVFATVVVLALAAWADSVRLRTLTEECDAGRASACAKLTARP